MSESIANPAPSRPLGVYVHFPWCLKKCPYCDFLSVAAARDAIPHAAYADAVLRELSARLPELAPGAELRTVFFGGGTPSLWATEELGRVLAGVLEAFRGHRADDVEVTAECNPTSLDLTKARALRDVGVNRLSLGVQGLDAERLAFLGRLSPEKRPDLAFEIARRVGLPLKIAAKADPIDHAYFEAEIRPQLDDPLVEYLGEVGDADKSAFLAGAVALLFPIDWPEPFGLAMIEAMACGTPVIARPCGAVPEVVVPGRTGFVGESIVDLVDGVKRIETIDRRECRRHVEALFSVARMADGYEALYRRLTLARVA